MSKIKKILIIIASIVILIAAAVVTIFQLNQYYLELSVAEEVTTLEYGMDELPEITAICKGTILNKEGTPISTTMEGELNTEKLGTYTVFFKALYKNMEISEEHTFVIQDTTAPRIELVSDPNHFTSPVAQYEEEGFLALDNYDGNITDQVVREETKDKVTYTVSDSSGNKTTVEREIIYKDVIAPILELTGGEEMSFNIGSDFEEPGYTATDDVDGNISDVVRVEGTVDGHKEGTYTLTYSVEDSSGNKTILERKVTVKDTKAPVIKLKGESSYYLLVGDNFKDPGFTATDNIDGDLTDQVKVEGKVNTKKTGQHTLTYKVTDSSGNTTTLVRSIFVYKKQTDIDNAVNGDKVVYLTFDDGPSKYTERVLDILDKYGVKATFFVTNQFPSYKHMIGEAYDRGHTIALHTYKHDYAQVYKSVDAYYSDLQKIQDLVIEQTGSPASIIRFPGGTSNTISRHYSSGIMTKLAKSVEKKGYQYCDWNVDSGDAGGTKTSSGVANNVINGMKKNKTSIVLQHDISSYSVEAVDKIISWGLANGYTFLPMSSNSPVYHFKPNN